MKMYGLITVFLLVIVSCKSPSSEPMKTGDIRNLGTSLSTMVATESTYVIINRSSGKVVSIIEKYGRGHYISPPKKVTNRPEVKMSLDVSLYSVEKKKVMCYSCMHEHEEQEQLYYANITHNLNKMASKAGIYKALWRPEEIGAKYAKDIIEIVEKGLEDLKVRPEYFKQFNNPNGWGTYEHFVPFVSDYLDALKEYPDAEIYISR